MWPILYTPRLNSMKYKAPSCTAIKCFHGSCHSQKRSTVANISHNIWVIIPSPVCGSFISRAHVRPQNLILFSCPFQLNCFLAPGFFCQAPFPCLLFAKWDLHLCSDAPVSYSLCWYSSHDRPQPPLCSVLPKAINTGCLRTLCSTEWAQNKDLATSVTLNCKGKKLHR